MKVWDREQDDWNYVEIAQCNNCGQIEFVDYQTKLCNECED